MLSGQVCLYCGKAFEPKMVPFVMPSRLHVNIHFSLHVRCVEAAFAGAQGELDAEDMAVDVGVLPFSESWIDMPDDGLPDFLG